MTDPTWRKSSHSGAEGGNCIELADLAPHIGVRDSKHLDGPHLSFTRSAFRAFVQELRAGQHTR